MTTFVDDAMEARVILRCLTWEATGMINICQFVAGRIGAIHAGNIARQLRGGGTGKRELLKITSREPEPPPIAYLRVSGGLFRDMMIHDFDMARWLAGEEPAEFFAAAGVLIDPAIGEAGDVDTAVVTLRMHSGALCQISNSRRAVYGYDQRIEAFGSKGALRAENVVESTVAFAGADGIVTDKPLHFFLERYAQAYRREPGHLLGL